MFAPPEGASGLFGQTPEVVGTRQVELEIAAATAQPLNDLNYLDIEGRSLEADAGTQSRRHRHLDGQLGDPALPAGGAGRAVAGCGLPAVLSCRGGHRVAPRPRATGALPAPPRQDSRNAGSKPALSILRAKRLAWAALREAVQEFLGRRMAAGTPMRSASTGGPSSGRPGTPGRDPGLPRRVAVAASLAGPVRRGGARAARLAAPRRAGGSAVDSQVRVSSARLVTVREVLVTGGLGIGCSP